MKGYRDTRLLEMLDYIDPKYIEKTKKYYKSVPVSGAAGAKIDPKKQIKYITALVAAVLLLSAFIPAVTYIIQNHLHFAGYSETTGGDTTLAPEITSEEITSSPEPESSAPETTETEPTHETTEPLYDGTTAEPDVTTSPELEYDGTRGLAYSVTGNQAKLIGIGSCTEKNLEIASVYRGIPVTAIGYGALSNHTEIESITIPEGVKQIETLAFSGCTNLKSVHISASVSLIAGNAFDNCPALESITVAEGNEYYSGTGNCLVNKKTKTLFLGCKTTVIPDDGSVEKIAEGAFSAIPGLRELVIPEGVKTVSKDAITGCPDLEKISLPATLETYEAGAVRSCTALSEIKVSDKNATYVAKGNCLINTTLKRLVLGCSESIIPDDMGIVYIEESAFTNAALMQSIVIPQGVTTVYARAFEGCTSLKNVSLPESLKTISDYAFFGCSALEAIEFPRNFKTIGIYAFSECTSLKSLDIGNYIEQVGEAAFKNCTGLKTLVIGRLSSWGNSDVYFGKSAFEGCYALETVDVTATGLISYGEAVFKNCTSLKSFKLIETYYYVAKEMFYGCKSLSEIEFDDNLSEIRTSAFYGCSSLNNIRVGINLTKLQANAFADCTSLEEFIYEGKTDEWYGVTRDSTWHSGTKLTAVKCSDGNANLSSAQTDHDGTVGTVYLIDEKTKTATLVGLGKWWGSVNGTQVATTYKGYPVTKIADGLFSGKTYIPKTFSLPSSIKVIGKEAFAYKYLTGVNLTLPIGLTEIGEDAFRGCFSVTTLTYLGTKAEWNAIKKGENWNLGAAFTVVHCTDGDVELKIDTVLVDGTPGLTYSVSEDRTAHLSGLGSCTETDIVIATTYKGYKVTGIGDHALRDKAQIKSVVIPEGITYIDERAFYNCTSLEHVVLPKSLRSIGGYAFSWCPALKSIDLPEGLTTLIGTAFYETSIKKLYIPKAVTEIYGIACDSLETLEIHPDNPRYRSVGNCFIDKDTKTLIQVFGQPTFPNDGSIEIIGEGAIWGRDDITELIFPEGVRHIFYSSVGRLKNLKKLHIPSTLVEIEYPIESSFGLTGLEVITVAAGNPIYYAKENCLIKKDTGTLILGNKYGKMPTDGSIKGIGPDAFAGLANLKSIVIPEGVDSIGSGAFSGCTSLQSVKFPESLESIGSWAFYGCTSLKKVSIGDKVKYFGTEVFAGCTALDEITLPKQVEYWSWGIFDSCKSLRRIVVPYGVKDFDIRNCDNLTEVILPETVTHASFNDCTSLRTVILPQSMTSMYDIFNGCTALEEITLPSGLTKIYSEAFRDCVSLKKIVIEGDITEIGSEAFKNCSSLETITLPASLTAIKSNAFRGCIALREIVFEGSMAEWEKISKGANWDTETVLAVIKCTDGKITADAQPEDYSDIEKLPEALKAVLLGKSTFRYAGTDKDMLLDDIETYWESGRLADMEHVAYAVVDMDGDGALEVVVSSYCTKDYYESNTGDKIILREYNGKVYGYHFSGSILDGDYMEDIKTDGSFMWCPKNPNYDCYATISFSGSGYTITTHCKYRSFGATFEYMIGNTKVTREEFNEYTKRFAKDQVIWYDLDRYPLGSSEQN